MTRRFGVVVQSETAPTQQGIRYYRATDADEALDFARHGIHRIDGWAAIAAFEIPDDWAADCVNDYDSTIYPWHYIRFEYPDEGARVYVASNEPTERVTIATWQGTGTGFIDDDGRVVSVYAWQPIDRPVPPLPVNRGWVK